MCVPFCSTVNSVQPTGALAAPPPSPPPPSCTPLQELLFFNSLKMKMSVILGITQMTFGLILKVRDKEG
jgi:vacuolar-type H+-ATPase subunit I/STV1